MEANESVAISVIVPVYNSEEYLAQCIDSILAQTYTDFELILVDDGSTDSSGKICDDYARGDNRVIVIHKENAGVSAARNDGIERAKGNYITFVDSDDYIDSNFLESSFIAIGEAASDLLICGYMIEVFNCGKLVKTYIRSAGDCKYTIKPLLEDMVTKLRNVHLGTPWGKLFKRNVVNRYKIRFRVDMDYGEDTYFVYQYLDTFHDEMPVVFIEKAFYHYRLGDGNSLSQRYNRNKMEFSQILFEQRIEIYTRRQCSNESIKQIEIDHVSSLISCIITEIANIHQTNKNYVFSMIRGVSVCELVNKISCSSIRGYLNKTVFCLLKAKFYGLLYRVLLIRNGLVALRKKLKKNVLLFLENRGMLGNEQQERTRD